MQTGKHQRKDEEDEKMYGIDYAQAVDPEIDAKKGELEELLWQLGRVIETIDGMRRQYREDYARLKYSVEEYKTFVEDDIEALDKEIDRQLHECSPSCCD